MLVSHYQPIVDAASGVVVAFEALLRAEVDGQRVAPLALFEQARDEGWLLWLDQQARRTAILGAAGWLRQRTLFINFVPSTVYDPARCLATTLAAAREAVIPLRHLVFEVVETEAIRDVAHLRTVFAEYRRMGCRVALDDVGAGHNTVEVLVALEPDVVKLDRRLIAGLPSGATFHEAARIVATARQVGAMVLAEGVETADEHDAAVRLGAHLAQGWFHGRPAPAPAAVR